MRNSAADELKNAILSIDGPYIDLSKEENLFAQDMPLQNHFEAPPDRLPLAEFCISSASLELVANDRFESSLNIDLSIAYEVSPEEGRGKGLDRGRQCVRQITDRILNRQRSGEALAALYLNGAVQVEAVAPQLIDLKPGESYTAVATARFTLNQIEFNEEADNA